MPNLPVPATWRSGGQGGDGSDLGRIYFSLDDKGELVEHRELVGKILGRQDGVTPLLRLSFGTETRVELAAQALARSFRDLWDGKR